MDNGELNVVTGAFSYTGKYIARRLLALGKRVRTLTGRPQSESPFGDQVMAYPFNFRRPEALRESLRGVTTLYNTYWIRFPWRDVTFDKAVANTRVLIKAAEEAGVRRLVHISITNATEDSPLPYFRGKALVEKAIRASSLSYAIVRPTVVFGTEDILINNIAWFLRKFPAFSIPGSGEYRLQPIFVDDVAKIAVDAGQQEGRLEGDAAGPDTYTFDELVRLIAEKIHSRARIVHLPPGLALFLSQQLGHFLGDVVLTKEEVAGLMSGLLVSGGPPTAKTRLPDWLEQNAGTVGTQYISELRRHYRRPRPSSSYK
ncbi:MAG: NAD(P)H-binding protein [Chloroflexi bacterium]|nr:NAD(P)H-binding protein [Chloroflexota bacterium]